MSLARGERRGPCSRRDGYVRALAGGHLERRSRWRRRRQLSPSAWMRPTWLPIRPPRARISRSGQHARIGWAASWRRSASTARGRSASSSTPAPIARSLSQALAARLGLTPNGVGEVHSVHGVAPAPLVEVDSLNYGELSLGSASMPMLHGAVLAGEHGLLGVDGMRGRRLRMDFERNCIEIVPSRGARRLRGWAAIRGELRFGHLVVVPRQHQRRARAPAARHRLGLDTGQQRAARCAQRAHPRRQCAHRSRHRLRPTGDPRAARYSCRAWWWATCTCATSPPMSATSTYSASGISSTSRRC